MRVLHFQLPPEFKPEYAYIKAQGTGIEHVGLSDRICISNKGTVSRNLCVVPSLIESEDLRRVLSCDGPKFCSVNISLSSIFQRNEIFDLELVLGVPRPSELEVIQGGCVHFAKNVNFGANNFTKLIGLSRATKTRFSGLINITIGFQPPILLFGCRALCVIISLALFYACIQIYYIRRRHWIISV